MSPDALIWGTEFVTSTESISCSELLFGLSEKQGNLFRAGDFDILLASCILREYRTGAGAKDLLELDVANNNITDAGFIELAKVLPDIVGLQTFDCCQNQMTEVGASAIADAIASMPSLQRLQLSPVLLQCTQIRKEERLAFGYKDTYMNAIRRNCSAVEIACRDVNLQVDGDAEVPVLSTYRSCIERIIISSYTLSRDWYRQLPRSDFGEGKKPCVQTMCIQRVVHNLGHPQVRDPGNELDNPRGKDSQGMFINSILRDNACFGLIAVASFNKRLKVLRLKMCDLTDAPCMRIFDYMGSKWPVLEELDLSYNFIGKGWNGQKEAKEEKLAKNDKEGGGGTKPCPAIEHFMQRLRHAPSVSLVVLSGNVGVAGVEDRLRRLGKVTNTRIYIR